MDFNIVLYKGIISNINTLTSIGNISHYSNRL